MSKVQLARRELLDESYRHVPLCSPSVWLLGSSMSPKKGGPGPLVLPSPYRYLVRNNQVLGHEVKMTNRQEFSGDP